MTRAHVEGLRASARVLPFLTPVRGHAFASTPPGDPAPVRRGRPASLVREPDNPADRWAIAVWAAGHGTPWRIGYLERAVAARLAPRMDAGEPVTATLAGWWDEPQGRWRRPVVAVEVRPPRPTRPTPMPSRIWGRPPATITRPVG